MRPAIGLALGWLAATATAASAQNPLVLNRLRELDAKAPQPSTAELQASLLSTAKALGQAKSTCVPSAVKVQEVAPITGDRAVLAAALAGQIRNAWTLYAAHEGCPVTGPFRYMVVQKADGALLAPLVNQGRTFANPTLMRDTSAGAALAALQKAKSLDPQCTGDTMEMGPTKVAAQSADLGPEVFGVRYVGSWTEIWRFTTCGKSLDVPVEFRADGDGGAYTNVKGSEVLVVN